jgi:hypothetical protein
MKSRNTSMPSHAHAPPPYQTPDTPASIMHRRGYWAALLAGVLFTLGAYVMPGSRKILAENQEAVGFALAMLALALVLLTAFLLSKREERVTFHLK